MRQFIRSLPPTYLTDNWEKWGKEYAQKKTTNKSYEFQWKQYKKQKLNLLLSYELMQQTQGHCSYCDFYPMRISDNTIDHFKPKSDIRFYIFVYLWENLYSCCANCQNLKWEKFDEALLRPDNLTYSFDRYFIINYSTGEIHPNPSATIDDRYRAAVSIEIFGFNSVGQALARKHSFQRYANMPHTERDLNDFAFRFLFD